MKNIFILLAVVFTYTNLFAQGIPVTHSIEKRNVVLEDFTGINCPNCPNGHKYANQIETNNPGDVTIINIHTGSYANPQTGQPDFRTAFGPSLDANSHLTGYPSATVNRHVFPGLVTTSGYTAIVNRANWVTAAEEILLQNSIANIGVKADIDYQTHLLTVQVQIYYTGSPSYPSNNRINVALLQNNIEGYQSNMAGNPDQVLANGNYNHMHMLRHLITGQWGKQIYATVGPGVTIDSTWAYSLPENIRSIPVVLGDLKIAVFLTDGQNEVITGHTVRPTFINMPGGVNSSKTISATMPHDVVCGFTAAPVVTIQNWGDAPLTSLDFDYSINNSPVKTMHWTGNVLAMEEKQIALDGINFFESSINTLTISTHSPNGATDLLTNDDEVTDTFSMAFDVDSVISMTLQLDNYGDEVTWEVVNSAGTTLYSGGPYQQTQSPPAPITQTFNLARGDCYAFVIHDDYGDGVFMNGQTTGLTLRDNQNVILVSNYADYGSQGYVAFGIDAPKADSSDVFPPDTTNTGILSPKANSGIQVFPNPTNNEINVNMGFTGGAATSLYLTDLLGKRVKTVTQNSTDNSNFVRISVADLTPGVYFLNAEVAGKNYTQKVLVTQ